MADGVARALLRSWELADLIKVFSDNNINARHFKILLEDKGKLKKIIPKSGIRAIFISCVNKYCNDSSESDSADSEEADSDDTDSEDSDSSSDEPVDGMEIRDASRGENAPQETIPADDAQNSHAGESNPQNPAVVDLLDDVVVENKIEPVLSDKQRFYKHIKELNIKDILEGSPNGKSILLHYEKHKSLSGTMYRVLMSILTDVMYSSVVSKANEESKFFRLRKGHLKKLAKKCSLTFPRIKKETFYVPPNTYKNQKLSRGKISDTYNNKRTAFRSLGLIPAKRRSKELKDFPSKRRKMNIDGYSQEEINDMESSIAWLEANTGTHTEILQHWGKSRPLRLHRWQEHEGETAGHFEKFPVLKAPSGHKLMIEDYAFIHENGDSLVQLWPSFVVKVLPLLNEKIRNFNQCEKDLLNYCKSPECNEDSQCAIILSLLSFLCPLNRQLKRDKSVKVCDKPSRSESSETLILHVQISSQIREKIDSCKDILLKKKRSYQPRIIVVGQDLKSISHAYISVDEEIYLCDSVLKAIDGCYKIIQLFNLEYAAESLQSWLLIQRWLYKYTHPSDECNSNLLNLLNSLAD